MFLLPYHLQTATGGHSHSRRPRLGQWVPDSGRESWKFQIEIVGEGKAFTAYIIYFEYILNIFFVDVHVWWMTLSYVQLHWVGSSGIPMSSQYHQHRGCCNSEFDKGDQDVKIYFLASNLVTSRKDWGRRFQGLVQPVLGCWGGCICPVWWTFGEDVLCLKRWSSGAAFLETNGWSG